jgi:hypothetical protein
MLEGRMNPRGADHLPCGGHEGGGHDQLLENEGLSEGVIDLTQTRPVVASDLVNDPIKIGVRA